MVIPRKILVKPEKPSFRKTPRKKIENEIEEIKVETSIKKPVKQKEPLSLRKDVVYKTLIRSIKRYLTEKCNLLIEGF